MNKTQSLACAIENISKNIDGRGMSKGYKYNRSPEGIVLNKDGSPRINAFAVDRYADDKAEQKILAAHRQGSLGEDQESIMV